LYLSWSHSYEKEKTENDLAKNIRDREKDEKGAPGKQSRRRP
jgi:hypothetical protein